MEKPHKGAQRLQLEASPGKHHSKQWRIFSSSNGRFTFKSLFLPPPPFLTFLFTRADVDVVVVVAAAAEE